MTNIAEWDNVKCRALNWKENIETIKKVSLKKNEGLRRQEIKTTTLMYNYLQFNYKLFTFPPKEKVKEKLEIF